MKRLSRRPRSLLLLTALTLLSAACDHQDGGPIGPLDVDGDRTHQVSDKKETRRYVKPLDLDLEWTLNNSQVPAGQSTEVLARIVIKAPKALDMPRPPAHVVLVVDTSASMAGEAIEGAKRAAAELVDGLAEGDSFSLVVFHSRAEVLMPSTIINEDSRAAAKDEIETMQAWGTTDLAGGLGLALGQLGGAQPGGQPHAGGPDPLVLERVVLLGDGVPNDASPIAALTQQFAARGTEITALGYGLEYDETLLASLAEQTHGHFHFVDEPDAVAALFRDEVLHIQRTVARDLALSFGLGPGVQLREVVGRPVQWNSGAGRAQISLGSMSEGQTHELVVRLAVGPHNEGATVEISDLELAFADVYTGTGQRFERGFLSAKASADPEALAAGENVEVARLGARAQTSAATLEVLQLARSGQTKKAKARLSAAVDWALGAAERLEDADLERQAQELAALEPELASLAPVRGQQGAVGLGAGAKKGEAGPQAFAPAPPPSTPGAARRVRKAHSEAYNDIH